MDDVISRHGVSAWLNNMGYPNLAKIVMDKWRFPSVQSEIIHCKDCKYGILDSSFPHQWFCKFKGDEWNNGDYFCGHARERGD